MIGQLTDTESQYSNLMGALERLPGWVKLLFGGGGALMFAFSNRLPDGVQSLGAILGLALVCIATIGAALHFVKEMRKGKNVEPHDLLIVQ